MTKNKSPFAVIESGKLECPITSTLAINVGGTTVKWAVITSVSTNASHCDVHTVASPKSCQDFAIFLRQISQEISITPDRVVIGIPGPVGAHGELSVACTLWPGEDLSKYRLADAVHASWPEVVVSVINDVSAYGQYLIEQGETDFCVINIGSGIGSKLYVATMEVTGEGRRGGEIGHWVDPGVPSGLVCDCGSIGHVGAISSGRGVLRYMKMFSLLHPDKYAASSLGSIEKDPIEVTSEQLISAAHTNDIFVMTVFAEAMKPLARATALVHLATGCERFFLVGGFAQSMSEILPALLAELSRTCCWSNGFDWSTAYVSLPDEVRASLYGLHCYGIKE